MKNKCITLIKPSKTMTRTYDIRLTIREEVTILKGKEKGEKLLVEGQAYRDTIKGGKTVLHDVLDNLIHDAEKTFDKDVQLIQSGEA